MRLIFGLLLIVTAATSIEDFNVQLPYPPAMRPPVPVRPFRPSVPGQLFLGQPMFINSQTYDAEEEGKETEEIDVPSENGDNVKHMRPGNLKKISHIPIMPPTTESYEEEEEQHEGESSKLEVNTPVVNEYLQLTKNLNFDCSEHPSGFYANVDTDCRIWHVCVGNIRYDRMCPFSTRFHQKYRTCAHDDDVDCSESPKFYDMNKNLYTSLKPATDIPMRKKIKRRRTTTPAPSEDYVVDFDSSQIPIADSQQDQKK